MLNKCGAGETITKGICKAAIPVARLEVRFLPAFKNQPKKMLPLMERAPAVV